MRQWSKTSEGESQDDTEQSGFLEHGREERGTEPGGEDLDCQDTLSFGQRGTIEDF